MCMSECECYVGVIQCFSREGRRDECHNFGFRVCLRVHLRVCLSVCVYSCVRACVRYRGFHSWCSGSIARCPAPLPTAARLIGWAWPWCHRTTGRRGNRCCMIGCLPRVAAAEALPPSPAVVTENSEFSCSEPNELLGAWKTSCSHSSMDFHQLWSMGIWGNASSYTCLVSSVQLLIKQPTWWMLHLPRHIDQNRRCSLDDQQNVWITRPEQMRICTSMWLEKKLTSVNPSNEMSI